MLRSIRTESRPMNIVISAAAAMEKLTSVTQLFMPSLPPEGFSDSCAKAELGQTPPSEA